MAYPATLDSYSAIAGTSTLAAVDHGNLHNVVGSAVVNIETAMGTTAGTNVHKNFAAGDFPARINASNVLQQALTGTVTITSGTASNLFMGTPTVKGTLALQDVGIITQTGTADHITLTPGASKTVKLTTLRSNNGTTLYQNASGVQSGWTFVTGDNSIKAGKYVTFPNAFLNKPIVNVCLLGYKDGSDPTDVDDLAQIDGIYAYLGTLTVGSAQLWCQAVTGTIPTTRRIGLNFIAVGSV